MGRPTPRLTDNDMSTRNSHRFHLERARQRDVEHANTEQVLDRVEAQTETKTCKTQQSISMNGSQRLTLGWATKTDSISQLISTIEKLRAGTNVRIRI